jgi:8-oxo-dGTP diphosphatase
MTRRRRIVVVYVTRENPVTGDDELLLFDVVDRPEFAAVVPGGGMEPGETVVEAALREVKEETGLDVRVVRELGSADHSGMIDSEHIHETHFVQVAPTTPTEDGWEHRNPPGIGVESDELVRCHWAPVSAELQVWGYRGAKIHDLVRRRVVAYITRDRHGRTELLTIEHKDLPEAGIQVPAGRVDPGETLEQGVLREVAEETGLDDVHVVRGLPEFEAEYENPYESYAFHLVSESETSDSWEHPVHGEGSDAGLVYVCRWVPLTPDLRLWNGRDPMLRHLP